jgi:hypothetical protein
VDRARTPEIGQEKQFTESPRTSGRVWKQQFREGRTIGRDPTIAVLRTPAILHESEHQICRKKGAPAVVAYAAVAATAAKQLLGSFSTDGAIRTLFKSDHLQSFTQSLGICGVCGVSV